MDPFLDSTINNNKLGNSELDTQTNLPDDCLINIYQRLDNIEDRNAFGLTCHSWLRIQNIAQRSLTFHISYHPKTYQVYIEYLPRLLVRFPHLSSVSLAGCTEIPDLALSSLRDSGSSLRSLSLYDCFGITDNSLALVAKGCPHLVSITLNRCNVTDTWLECLATYCQALRNINLSYCTAISDKGIRALSRGCHNLHTLMITKCKGITGTGFTGCPPTLTYLEADSCMLTPEGLSGAVSGGGLVYLNLSSMRHWAGADCLKGIGAGFARNLRFLNLRMCQCVCDETVAAIAKGCPLLEELSLSECRAVKIRGWEAIGSDCKNLKVLQANHCRNLCDLGLLALRNGCHRLAVLHIHGCLRVTKMGYEMFKLLRQDVKLNGEGRLSIGPCIDHFFA